MLILEILVAGDEEVRRWSQGCQLKERTILLVANWCDADPGTYQLCHLHQYGIDDAGGWTVLRDEPRDEHIRVNDDPHALVLLH